MKIAIIGSGAMGSLYGGILSQKNEVYLIDVWQEHIDVINRSGLTTFEKDGTQNLHHPKGFYSSAGLPIMDLVLIFVKSIHTRESIQQSKNIIGPNTLVLTLQNGYGNDLDIMEVVNADNVSIGTTNHGCTLKGPGIIYHAGSGVTTIGSATGNAGNVQIVAQTLEDCGFEVEIHDNIKRIIFHKLLINTGINPLTAIFDVDNGLIKTNPHLWGSSKKLLVEAIQVARAIGVDFDEETIFKDVLNVAEATAENQSSMRSDILKKRKTEIEKINGAFVKIAKENGLEAPCNELITEMIRFMESKYN